MKKEDDTTTELESRYKSGVKKVHKNLLFSFDCDTTPTSNVKYVFILNIPQLKTEKKKNKKIILMMTTLQFLSLPFNS